MNLSVVSYRGLAINDTTNYTAKLIGAEGFKTQPVQAIYQQRQWNGPVLGIKVASERTIVVTIKCNGANPATQMDTLKKYFDPLAQDEYALICADTENSNKQWQLYATPLELMRMQGGVVWFVLACGDGVWKAVTQQTDSWSLTASAQSHTVSPQVVGNAPTPPVITYKPTSAKTGGYAYRARIDGYNPTDTPVTDPTPYDVTAGGIDTATLLADNTNKCQIDGGINDSVTTVPYDTVTGSIPSRGMGYIDDTTNQEQISWTGKTGTTSGNLTGVTRAIGGTTAHAFADNVEIKLSYVLANGNDIRLFDNGVEIDRWLGTGSKAINTATTEVWANLSFQARIEGTLLTAISNVGTPSTIDFTLYTRTQKLWFSRLPTIGRLKIENEIFAYSAKDSAAGTVTVFARSVGGTSAASHAAGVTIRWLEHDLWLVYDNQDAVAPTPDDTKKPIIDLNSTNTSHIYSVFTDVAHKRTGRWSGAVIVSRGGKSVIYTADHNTEADPAAEMGMSVKAYQKGSRWLSESAILEWRIYVPGGVTTVTATGEKYRNQAAWPTVTLDKSTEGVRWVTVWTEATPSAASSWEALASHSAVSLSGTYPYLRIRMSGGVNSGSGYEADHEVGDMTLALDSTTIIQWAIATAVATYDIDTKIENTSTNEYIILRRQIDLNQTLQIDCDNKTVTYLKDNTPGPQPILSTNRAAWLSMRAGAANVIKVTETGLTGVDVGLSWYDRNN